MERNTPMLFGEPIRRTFTMKLVGMKISHTRNAGYFQKYLLKKATKQWAKVKHSMGQSKYFSMTRWLQLINSRVRPHMEYLSGAWGYYLWGTADTVYTSFLKAALGLERNSPIVTLYDETQLMPLGMRRHARMLNLWHKILEYPKTHYIRILYEEDRYLQSSRWAGTIMNVLKAYNLLDHWVRQSTKSEVELKWSTKVKNSIRKTFIASQKFKRSKMQSAKTMQRAIEGRDFMIWREKAIRKAKEVERKSHEDYLRLSMKRREQQMTEFLNKIRKAKGTGPIVKKIFADQCMERNRMKKEIQATVNKTASALRGFKPAFLKSSNRSAAKILTRIRSGSSNLSSHLTRKRTRQQEKKCPACGKKKHETPYHFLVACELYKTERRNLITQNNWGSIPKVPLLPYLLGELDSLPQTNNLLKFIYQAYIKREKIVNKANGRKTYWIRMP